LKNLAHILFHTTVVERFGLAADNLLLVVDHDRTR